MARPGKSLLTAASALGMAALVLLGACGRKGDLIIPGTVLPAQVGAVSAEPAGDAVVLAWEVPRENSRGEPLYDLAGFSVMRARLTDGLDDCPCVYEPAGYVDMEYPEGAVVRGDRVAWTDKDPALAPGDMYAYTVAAVNSSGYAGPASRPLAVRLLSLPAAPSGLAAVPGDGSVELGWEAVGVDTDGAAYQDPAGYNVYRTQGPGPRPDRPVNAEPVTGPGYTDTGLANGTGYCYTVTALRGSVAPLTEGAPSAAACAVPADKTAPAPPAGLRAVPGEGLVLLSWDPNVEEDLAGYVVYRKGPGDDEPVPQGAGPSPGITWQDDAVEPAATYDYHVTAVDRADPPNESPPSDTASVTAR